MTLTATAPSESEDLSSILSWVRESHLPVDLLTVPNVKSPKLTELTQYGSLFDLPYTTTAHDRGAMAGAIFMAMVENIEETNFQQIANVVKDPLNNNWVDGTFQIRPDMTSKESPKFQLLILSPWITYPQVEVIIEAPDGTTWSTEINSIFRVWSSHVLQLSLTGLKFQVGTWTFSIRGPGSNSLGKIHVIAFVDVGSQPIGRSFFQSSSNFGLNATEDTFAVSVFTSLEQVSNLDQNWTIKATIIQGFTNTELVLKDDGLIGEFLIELDSTKLELVKNVILFQYLM